MAELVSVGQTDQIEDLEVLKVRIRKLIAPFGGLNCILGSARKVLLKPNLVAARDFRTGAVTNPYLVRAFADLALESGAKTVFVGDGAAVGTDTEEVFEAGGYRDVLSPFLEEGRIHLVDFKKGRFLEKGIPEGTALGTLEVPQVLEKADALIDLPVLKTHNSLPVTLGIKNLKGLIREGMKKEFHRIGLLETLVDLHRLVKPDLVLYDGTVAMEGLGPTQGDPVNLGALLASTNPVAGDLAAARVMGYRESDLELPLAASEAGLGPSRLEEIKLAGTPLEEISYPFRSFSLANSFYGKLGLGVHDRGGCSGCKHLLDTTIKDFREVPGYLHDIEVYTGSHKEIPTDPEKNVLLGNCLAPCRESGTFVPGCPPYSKDLEKAVREKVEESD